MEIRLAQNQISRRVGRVQNGGWKAQQAVVAAIHNPEVALGVASDSARSVHAVFGDATEVGVESAEIGLAVNRVRLRIGRIGGRPGEPEHTVVAKIGYVQVPGRAVNG